MTQKLCKSYQYHQDNQEELIEINTREELEEETKEMMRFIKNMSSQKEKEQELSDNDSYWSEDEFAVIKAYYENEQEDEEEEIETRNLIIILKQQKEKEEEEKEKKNYLLKPAS